MGKKEGKKWWISPPYQHVRTCCYFHQVTQEVRLAGLAVGPLLLVFLIASWCTRSRVVSSAGSASWPPAGLGGGWGSLASNFSHKYSADPVCTKERGSKQVEGFGLIICGLFLARQERWTLLSAIIPIVPPAQGPLHLWCKWGCC